MTKPVKRRLQPFKSWDADLSADFESLYNEPFPIFEEVRSNFFPSFNATQYQGCLAWVYDTRIGNLRWRLFRSDGTNWITLLQFSGSAQDP